MANIIINNYCNQTCSYCFAWKNMEDTSLQQEMALSTFLYCLKHLQNIGDKKVRILGGEPLLHSKIEQIFRIVMKGGFKLHTFSNLKIPISKWEKILNFGTEYDYSQFSFNLNLNDKEFYKQGELEMIYDSLHFLKKKGCSIMISYNVYEYSYKYDFIFETAQKFDVKMVVLKITNTVMGDKEIIDTNSKKYGNYIFQMIEENYRNVKIAFGCGLSSKIFTQTQKDFMTEKAGIQLKWGCENNGGKYDINTDGSIYRCFPLQSLYVGKNLCISDPLFQNNNLEKILHLMEGYIPRKKGLTEDENCLGNQMNKL